MTKCFIWKGCAFLDIMKSMSKWPLYSFSFDYNYFVTWRVLHLFARKFLLSAYLHLSLKKQAMEMNRFLLLGFERSVFPGRKHGRNKSLLLQKHNKC